MHILLRQSAFQETDRNEDYRWYAGAGPTPILVEREIN